MNPSAPPAVTNSQSESPSPPYDAVKDFIKDNPDFMEELEAKIKDKVKVDDSALLDKDAAAE
jgi:hypothetical protein